MWHKGQKRCNRSTVWHRSAVKAQCSAVEVQCGAVEFQCGTYSRSSVWQAQKRSEVQEKCSVAKRCSKAQCSAVKVQSGAVQAQVVQCSAVKVQSGAVQAAGWRQDGQ